MLNKIKRKMKWGLPLSKVTDKISVVEGTGEPAVKPATIRQYRDTCRRMIDFFGHDAFVESITRDEYAEYHHWLGQRGTSAITVNTYRRCSRAIWNHLAQHGYDVCDIEGITKMIAMPVQKSRAMSDEQLSRILEVASVRDSAIILYMAGAGFRRQTTGRIAVDNTKIWQRPDGYFRIASRIPAEKTSPPRVIMADHEPALACQLWLSIRRHQDSPWLFNTTSDGGQLADATVSSIFHKIRKRANLPARVNINPHALRHRFAQKMLDQFDHKTVAQWLGIDTNTLFEVYAFRSEDELLRKRFGELPPDW